MTNDPVADFHRHDTRQSAELDNLPVCSYCDNPIQDDFCYEINDELICESCLNDNHRKLVDDYVE